MAHAIQEHQDRLSKLFEKSCDHGGEKVAEIQTYLKKIELDYDVKILYACEAGSRAWKIHSIDSDFDIRFVYMHRMKWYTQISHQPDHMSFQEPEMNADIVGWEMRKALKLYSKSNPNFYEWVMSGIVYQWIPFFADSLLEMIPKFYTRKSFFHHHLSRAKKTYADYLSPSVRETHDGMVNIKKYLYVLQSIMNAQWVLEMDVRNPNMFLPPIEFHALVEVIIGMKRPKIREEVYNLLAWKHSHTENDYDEPIEIIDDYINEMMTHLSKLTTLNTLMLNTDSAPPIHELDRLIWGMMWEYGL